MCVFCSPPCSSWTSANWCGKKPISIVLVVDGDRARKILPELRHGHRDGRIRGLGVDDGRRAKTGPIVAGGADAGNRESGAARRRRGSRGCGRSTGRRRSSPDRSRTADRDWLAADSRAPAAACTRVSLGRAASSTSDAQSSRIEPGSPSTHCPPGAARAGYCEA